MKPTYNISIIAFLAGGNPDDVWITFGGTVIFRSKLKKDCIASLSLIKGGWLYFYNDDPGRNEKEMLRLINLKGFL